MRRAWCLAVLAALAALMTGCADSAPAPSTYLQRVIPGAAPEAVYDAARGILQREFGRVEADRDGQRLQSDPSEFDTARDSGTARDLVGGSTRMRRVAHCIVGKRSDGALVRIRVDVQRLDSSRRPAGRDEGYRVDDSPAYTPIDRDAATTEQQNTLWTTVRRDREMERLILDELDAQLGGEVAVPAADVGAAPAGPPPATRGAAP